MSHIAEHNYHAKQGDTFRSSITLEDQNGSAIDLTGAAVEFAFARSPGSTPAFKYTTSEHIDLSEAAGGIITITIPPAETAKWSQRRYVYEVTVTYASGVVTTLFMGRLDVEPDVVV